MTETTKREAEEAETEPGEVYDQLLDEALALCADIGTRERYRAIAMHALRAATITQAVARELDLPQSMYGDIYHSILAEARRCAGEETEAESRTRLYRVIEHAINTALSMSVPETVPPMPPESSSRAVRKKN